MDETEQRPAHDHELWESVALGALERRQQRQAQMVEQYGLRGDVQYSWSLDDATISFFRGGEEFLRGRITMIGSVDTVEQTWLWAWADSSLPTAVLGEIAAVRTYGEQNGFPLLARAAWQADQKPVAQARMLAADVLGAEGLWRDASGDMQLHFLLHDLHRPASA